MLELLQTWGMAFRSSPKYRIVTDTLNLMKAEGWKFPPVFNHYLQCTVSLLSPWCR